MSSTVTFKVPKEIKEKMKKYRLNWSKTLRDFLVEKIRELEAEENIKKIREMIKKTESVPQGFTVKSLREDRDSR